MNFSWRAVSRLLQHTVSRTSIRRSQFASAFARAPAVKPCGQFARLGEQRQMHAVRRPAVAHVAPDFFGREGQQRRQQPHQRVS